MRNLSGAGRSIWPCCLWIPVWGDGFRGPRYFLELADIRRFLPMHQWGNFNYKSIPVLLYFFTSRTVYVNRVGQVFTFEEEADT